jgi:hypothetical protein
VLREKVARKKALLRRQKEVLGSILEDRERLVEQVDRLAEVIEAGADESAFAVDDAAGEEEGGGEDDGEERPASKRDAIFNSVKEHKAGERRRSEHALEPPPSAAPPPQPRAQPSPDLAAQNAALKSLLRSMVLGGSAPEHPLHRRARARSSDAVLERLGRRTASNRGKVSGARPKSRANELAVADVFSVRAGERKSNRCSCLSAIRI